MCPTMDFVPRGRRPVFSSVFAEVLFATIVTGSRAQHVADPLAECLYTAEEYVVFSSAGHDLRSEEGTLASCQSLCCADTHCVGFSRSKSAADGEIAGCWLKSYAPEVDRHYGNSDYHTMMKHLGSCW